MLARISEFKVPNTRHLTPTSSCRGFGYPPSAPSNLTATFQLPTASNVQRAVQRSRDQ